MWTRVTRAMRVHATTNRTGELRMRPIQTAAAILLGLVVLLPLPGSAREPVRVEWREDRLSVSAERAPLAEILREVGRRTGLVVHGLETLRGDVSIAFSDLSLEEGLRRLLARVDHVLVEEPSPEGAGAPTLTVILAGTASGGVPAPAGAPKSHHAAVVHREPAERIALALADRDPTLRRWGMERVAEQSDSSALVRLLDGLRDADPGVREEAIAGLGQYGEAVVEPLRALLGRESVPAVRQAAIQLLGQVGGEAVAPLLGELLGDRDSLTRVAVVEALGHAGGAIAAAALSAAASDADAGVRLAARQTLAFYIEGPAPTDSPDEDLTNGEEDASRREAGARDNHQPGSVGDD